MISKVTGETATASKLSLIFSRMKYSYQNSKIQRIISIIPSRKVKEFNLRISRSKIIIKLRLTSCFLIISVTIASIVSDQIVFLMITFRNNWNNINSYILGLFWMLIIFLMRWKKKWKVIAISWWIKILKRNRINCITYLIPTSK